MSPETITTIIAAVAIIGFLWSLHRDIGGLHRDIGGLRGEMAGIRERLARLEGAVDILTKFLIDRERAKEKP